MMKQQKRVKKTAKGTKAAKASLTQKKRSEKQSSSNSPRQHVKTKKGKTASTVKSGKKQKAKVKAAARARREKNRQLRINLALTAGSTLFVWLVGLSFFFGLTKVSGYGMSPTLRADDTVIVKKTKAFKRFDLVLFKRGDTKQIRRIIGFPGETIVYENDVLFVDGEAVDEKFLVDKINESQRNGQDYTENFSVYDLLERQSLPEGKYLLLGDNRPYATDSRHYGLIDESMIIGVVQAKVFPLNEWMIY